MPMLSFLPKNARIFSLVAIVLCSLPASHAAGPEGSVILLRHTEGGRTTDFRYTLNADTARLDRIGEPTIPPSPWNLIDRKSGTLSIFRPHNQSISTLATDAFDRRPATPHGTPEGSELPELPQIPNPDHPSSIPGIPGGMTPGVPGGIPPMGIDDFLGGELATHEESREIHGHTCTRHTLSLGRSLELKLEIWLAESPDLPPFYLLIWDSPPHFGHNDLLEDWPHLIRKNGKFPLLATLREVERHSDFHEEQETAETKPARPELARWEVISIEPATPDPGLFQHPENFFQTDRTP